MDTATFDELAEQTQSAGPDPTLAALIDRLRDERDYHRMFDALLMRKKWEMGLPLTNPTSFDDVPVPQRGEFEEAYTDAARQTGQLLIDDQRVPEAFMYFHAIRDLEPVSKALETLDLSKVPDDQVDGLIQAAFHHGANPARGVQWMLEQHGTCSTITSLDQQLAQLSPEVRARCASLLVQTLYRDLKAVLESEVRKRVPMLPPNTSLRDLFAGREWLFADGNYHIDVSHLNSVVRFARSLNVGDDAIPQAVELAEYGSHLAEQYQYAGDPPFDDFYPAHIHFLNILAGQQVDESVQYFRDKLAAEPDEPDQQLIAYVLIDLLMRAGRLDEAVDLAVRHMSRQEEFLRSFVDLCRQAGRLDAVEIVAREAADPVLFTAALLEQQREEPVRQPAE